MDRHVCGPAPMCSVRVTHGTCTCPTRLLSLLRDGPWVLNRSAVGGRLGVLSLGVLVGCRARGWGVTEPWHQSVVPVLLFGGPTCFLSPRRPGGRHHCVLVPASLSCRSLYAYGPTGAQVPCVCLHVGHTCPHQAPFIRFFLCRDVFLCLP